MTSLAYAERERIRTAASAGRLLVPTRSLPDTMDVPRPFAPALRGHIDALLRLCQDTAKAAADASAQAGEAAAASPGRDASASRPRQPGPAITSQPRECAGAVQNALHELGVTSPVLLQRAADIDRASEQLIIEAAGQRGIRQAPPGPATPDRSAGSPALTHGGYAPGDPRAATPHHPVSGHQHEPRWPSPPARGEPGAPVPGAAQEADCAPPPARRDAATPAREARARAGSTPGGIEPSAGPADDDPAARWPAPDPRVARETRPPGRQAAASRAVSQTGRAGTAANAAVSRQTCPGDSGVPAADWRDQVLTGASQPWQPGPGQARDPAASVLPGRHVPGAGIEPDT